MTGVISFDWSRAYNRSRVFRSELGIRLKSHLSTRVGHMIGVGSSNRSQAYDRSHVIQPELGILPESHLLTEAEKYLHYKHV
jgi:hypothetical protein